MATILAASYPDLYAAVAVHSGLPVGSAHDVASAFGVMKAGTGAQLPPYRQPVPAIVFHGDRDRTVHPANGANVLAQCMGFAGTVKGAEPPCKTSSAKGTTAHGRTYTQTIIFDRADKPVAEHWAIHGSGHAWSGGSKAGSYTDPKGPDASSEMMRFFYAHPKQDAC
jgi:poly(3-hydroxybutyrate) depolymerase